jgi:iron complex outermembrane recepter protein
MPAPAHPNFVEDFMNRSNPLARAVRRALLSALAGSASFAAHAQDAGDPAVEDIGTIVVTGSRIVRPDLEASSPVTIVTGEMLKMAGTANVEEFLRDLPQLVPAIGGNTNNGSNGAATLDLRNLSEERTLVLVNGKRFVPFDSEGAVDLNMIPASLIERVEIVTGGASAVYGSDAIAGVVNFILRDKFEGFETEASFGQTGESDGTRKGFGVTMGVGLNEDQGHLVLNATYAEQEAVTMGARSFSERVLSSSTLTAGSGSATNPGGTILGVPAGGAGQPAGNYTFDASGNLIPYNAAQHGFNFNPYNLLQTPMKKWTATVLGTYKVSEQAEFFSRFSFANSRVDSVIAPSGTFFFDFDLNYATNPYINAQARSVLARTDEDGDGVTTVSFGRRTVELGTRDSLFENTAYQGLAGLRGNIGDSWNWEGFVQTGRTVRTQRFVNDIDVDRTQQALLAITDGAGNVVCSDPSGGCVPANLFGPGSLTDAAGQFIRLDLQQDDTTDQFVGGGFIGGDLPFTIPLASKPGAIIFGAEYRDERGEARPDADSIAGSAPGFGQAMPISSRINIKELYSEVRVPLITDKTFAQSVSIEAGVRRSDYKNAVPDLDAKNDFETTAWKAGAEWQPIESLRFRAMYQKAVRAPNLNEIGSPRANGTGDAANDYCASANFTPAEVADPANAALRDLCISTGVSLARLQAGSVASPISGQVSNYSGGNPELVPESSDTVTVGFVVHPESLDKLTVAVDYFDIKVEKAILATPEQAILDACYQEAQNPGLDPSNMFCALIHRNPLSGGLNGGLDTGVDASDRNIGFLQSRGVDLAASYSFDMGSWGGLALALNLTRQLKSDLRFTDNGPLYECVGTVGEICLRPDPKVRWVQSSSWSRGPITAQLRWRHLGSLTQDSVARGEAEPSDYAVPKISAFDYFDLGASYDLDKLTFRVGIENLLNEKPPVVGNDYGGTAENGGNTFPATYDVLGRSYFVSAVARF